MKKPIATTTAYPAAWGSGGSIEPLAAARGKVVDILLIVVELLEGSFRDRVFTTSNLTRGAQHLVFY